MSRTNQGGLAAAWLPAPPSVVSPTSEQRRDSRRDGAQRLRIAHEIPVRLARQLELMRPVARHEPAAALLRILVAVDHEGRAAYLRHRDAALALGARER